MTTRQTVQSYFQRLASGDGWQSMLAEDMVFSSFTSPVKAVAGKDAFLRATQRFYSMIARVELRDLMVDGERACALTRYELQPPNGGARFSSDVAEVFSVKNDRIESFGIYFDTSPYPRQ
jgi:ketosteroid isomerase-like protein